MTEPQQKKLKTTATTLETKELLQTEVVLISKKPNLPKLSGRRYHNLQSRAV